MPVLPDWVMLIAQATPSALELGAVSGMGTAPGPAVERALLAKDSAAWAAAMQSWPKFEGMPDSGWQAMALFWMEIGEMDGRPFALPVFGGVEPGAEPSS